MNVVLVVSCPFFPNEISRLLESQETTANFHVGDAETKIAAGAWSFSAHVDIAWPTNCQISSI